MRPKIFNFSPAPKYTYLVVGTFVSSKNNITVMRIPQRRFSEIFFLFGMFFDSIWSINCKKYILQVPLIKTDFDAYQNLPAGQSFRFFQVQNVTEISARSRIWDDI